MTTDVCVGDQHSTPNYGIYASNVVSAVVNVKKLRSVRAQNKGLYVWCLAASVHYIGKLKRVLFRKIAASYCGSPQVQRRCLS